MLVGLVETTTHRAALGQAFRAICRPRFDVLMNDLRYFFLNVMNAAIASGERSRSPKITASALMVSAICAA